ncbi:methyltransferase [Kutzneria buriramensis]|uniref:Methyltransferase family protein n=1 Tax=Kutzneria buriramensis TaxID=1045776 RepID=A0A3E0H5I9_9PSEU|nr:methyltransferase [Kutzneria buriramensis]REH38094.1 methyltransferase family protein [Kutzneria buriramensis]
MTQVQETNSVNEGLVADPPDTALLPESAQILLMATSKWVSQSLYVAAKLGIADVLADGPRTPAELAEATGTHARSLHRILRAIASVGVFAEDTDGRFGQTPLSEFLRADVPGSLRQAVIFFGEDFTWRPYGRILDTVRTGAPVFNKLNDVPDMFAYMAKNPESQEIFDGAMLALSGDSISDITERYDFAAAGKVVDIGGGQGFLVSEILRANPDTTAILFDQQSVVDGAVTGEFGDRVELVAGSFFETVPGGGDTYILKSVLHDWNDDQCADILGRVRKAIGDRADARLLIIEAVVPPLNAWGFAKFMDVEMMVNVGGVERTEAEWRDLFARAGFVLSDIVDINPPNSILVGRPA